MPDVSMFQVLICVGLGAQLRRVSVADKLMATSFERALGYHRFLNQLALVAATVHAVGMVHAKGTPHKHAMRGRTHAHNGCERREDRILARAAVGPRHDHR